MKGYYRLLQAELVYWLPFLTVLCAATIASPLVLLHHAMRDYGPYAVLEPWIPENT